MQIRLADSVNGVPWPENEEGVNSYCITGNGILNVHITEETTPELKTMLNNIKNALVGVRYTPCKVSVPATLDIRAGSTVQITDKNGKTFTAYVMTKTQSGQKDTLECTGSHRRDSTTSTNNMTSEEIANNAVNSQTQEDVFNKLTKNGTAKGFYLLDGELYINATYIKSGAIIAEGEAILPPTMEDVNLISKSFLDPETYPPEDYYDLNGNGRIENNDAVLGMMMATGQKKASDSPVLKPTKVTIRIDPFNHDSAISITGKNMWGSEVSVSFGITTSKIPRIDGDTGISGILSVGRHAIIPAIAIDGFSNPKTLSWRDNGDGTFTLIGT